MLKISLLLETGYTYLYLVIFLIMWICSSASLDLQARQVRSLHRSAVRAGAGGIFVVSNI